MNAIKRIFAAGILISAASAASFAQDPAGTVTYALPQTSITFEVEAVRENFFAGPYAKYAEKYLGVSARQENQSSCTVTSVKMTPYNEADPDTRFYVQLRSDSNFGTLTSQGLVAVSDGNFGNGSQWRFAAEASADFSGKGVSSNLTTGSTTLYRGSSSTAGSTTVQQSMVVQKSLEQRAKEAAEMVDELRTKRVQIVTGDTDATYSGEAMGAALEEISSLEKEYLSLFLGYSDFQTQTLKCDVVPKADQKSSTYVAFRVSDTDGLVPADNLAGKPYLLEIIPQTVSDASGKAVASKEGMVVYRIPAVCTVKLSDGVIVLLQDRIPVYQLGRVGYYPVK